MRTPDRIRLEGIEVAARIGITAAERERETTVVIDVEVRTDTRAAAASDDVADTVDYSVLYHAIRLALEGCRCHLLETLAERVAQIALDHAAALSVEVRVAKRPHDRDGTGTSSARHAAVVIERRRDVPG